MSNSLIHNVKEYIIDAFECKQDLADPSIAEKSVEVLKKAAKSAGATVIDVHYTAYTIHGFTTVALLAESHIILTTWPELNYASINIYMCNSNMDHNPALECLFTYLQPTSYRSSWVRHLSLSKRNNRIFIIAPFISYTNNNIFESEVFNEINSIISHFRKNDFSVFCANERKELGENQMNLVNSTLLDFQEMNQCDIVVALINDNSYKVSLELGWASVLKKPIILYMKDANNFPSALLEGIGQLTDTVVIDNYNSLLDSAKELEYRNHQHNKIF